MTGRDRIIAMALVVLVVIGGGWVLLVSPAKKEADKLSTEVQSAQSEVGTAEGALANAKAAEAKYASAYASIVSLGKAVPASQEVPSLIYELEGATSNKGVQFNSIVNGAGSSASGSTPVAAAAGFTQMPFTFTFEGGFSNLQHLFSKLTSFTNHDAKGDLQVSGRLLTVQSVKLVPAAGAVGSTTSALTGTITASAYVLPASTGLTAGATPSSPTGASSAASAPASASSTSTSATPPAIARVTP